MEQCQKNTDLEIIFIRILNNKDFVDQTNLFYVIYSRIDNLKGFMNENITISQAKEGSEQAFRQLYDNHKERIYRMAFHYIKIQQDAEDVMQETFIRAFKNITSFINMDNQSFTFWLNRICINCTMNHFRKTKHMKKGVLIPLTDVIFEPESTEQSPEKRTQINNTLAIIRKAAKKLSAKQRIIFDLRYTQHQSIKEIANFLNCSESNVKTQLSRAVAKLRKQLSSFWREE